MANLIAINAIKDKKIPNDDLINQFIKEFKDKESQNEKVVQLAFDTYDNSTLEVFNAFKDKYGQRKSSKEMDMFLWAYAKYYLLGDRGVKFG